MEKTEDLIIRFQKEIYLIFGIIIGIIALIDINILQSKLQNLWFTILLIPFFGMLGEWAKPSNKQYQEVTK